MAREADVKSTWPLVFNVGTGSSVFICLPPIPNQVGLMLQIKGTGGTLEIAGGGFSFSPGISSVLVAQTPTLVANGSGFPVPSSEVLTFSGNPYIWFSSGGITTTVQALYLKNSENGA